VSGAQRFQHRSIPGISEGGQLETDSPDIQTDIDAHGLSSLAVSGWIYK
jgi:hypothetical protein